MKKVLFYISIGFSIILLINILKIIFVDFNRLTDYGFGYLTGRIILLFVFLIIAYYTKGHRFSDKNKKIME